MPKILIADDSAEGRSLLHRILHSDNYDVISSKNGKEALHNFNKHQPDMIITDIKMPVMDGFELASAIRSKNKSAHIPIIFVSARYKDISTKIKAFDSGINEYLTLPLNRSELLHKVKSLIKSKMYVDEILKAHTRCSKREKKYRRLFNTISDAMYMIDSDTQNIIDCNNNAINMVGYTKKQITSMTIGDLFSEKEQGIVEMIFSKAGRGGALSGITGLSQVTRNSEIIPVEIDVTKFTRDKRKLLLTFVKNISRHKKIEDSLSFENNQLTTILDLIEEGVYITNSSYDIQYINPYFKKRYGSTAGKKCYEYFHTRKSICPSCKNPEIFRGDTVRWEWTSPANRHYKIIEAPIKNLDGSFSKLAIYRDITDDTATHDKVTPYSGKGDVMDKRCDKRVCPHIKHTILIDGSRKSRLMNISKGGICLQISKSMQSATIHEIQLLKDQSSTESIACIVIWSKAIISGSSTKQTFRYISGLKYIGMTRASRKSINAFMEEVEDKG